MNPLVYLLVLAIDIYQFLLIVWIIVSVLVTFKIVNPYQPLVKNIMFALNRMMEPALRPIRRYLPFISGGGIDFSPLILFMLIYFVRYTVVYYLA